MHDDTHFNNISHNLRACKSYKTPTAFDYRLHDITQCTVAHNLTSTTVKTVVTYVCIKIYFSLSFLSPYRFNCYAGDEARIRMDNLRALYTKYKKDPPSGSGVTWTHYVVLKLRFLERHIKARPSTSNLRQVKRFVSTLTRLVTQ